PLIVLLAIYAVSGLFNDIRRSWFPGAAAATALLFSPWLLSPHPGFPLQLVTAYAAWCALRAGEIARAALLVVIATIATDYFQSCQAPSELGQQAVAGAPAYWRLAFLLGTTLAAIALVRRSKIVAAIPLREIAVGIFLVVALFTWWQRGPLGQGIPQRGIYF